MALTGGVELKGAAEICKDVLEQVVQTAASTNKNSNAAVNIVETLITIGGLSVASVIASGFCGIISFVSLIVACCMSGKKRKGDAEHDANTSMIASPELIRYSGKGSPVVQVYESLPYQQSPPLMATQY